MKRLFLIVTVLALSVEGFSQSKPLSPKATIDEKIDGTSVEIVYCRPSARGRKVMGSLVPYGEVWRTGANAATTIEFGQDVQVEGKKLPGGKYELFTIPGEKEWTIIFQRYSEQWGAFSYKPANDVLRVNVKPKKTNKFIETFTIEIVDDQIVLSWENTMVPFTVGG